MFTIKYVYPTGQHSITGPYEMVTAEWVDARGNHVDKAEPPVNTPIYQTVYAYKSIANGELDIEPAALGATMTYGPNIPAESSVPTPHPRGLVFVMNEQGATIAKYEL